MAGQGRRTSPRFQGTRKPWHLSSRSSGFIEKTLKKPQTLSWKPVNEKTCAFLLSILEEAEMKVCSENSELISAKETEAVHTLTQMRKQYMSKLKSAYCPESKWKTTDMYNYVEWLEKMKAKNELLRKAEEEEERELEELDDELQTMAD